jgi:hypothetical protein
VIAKTKYTIAVWVGVCVAVSFWMLGGNRYAGDFTFIGTALALLAFYGLCAFVVFIDKINEIRLLRDKRDYHG